MNRRSAVRLTGFADEEADCADGLIGRGGVFEPRKEAEGTEDTENSRSKGAGSAVRLTTKHENDAAECRDSAALLGICPGF